MSGSLLERVAWEQRVEGFGELELTRPYASPVVTMPYLRPDRGGSARTAQLWERLGSVDLEAPLEIVDHDLTWLYLRYAAIDWVATRTPTLPRNALDRAIQLAACLDQIANHVDDAELGWLAGPRVVIDVAGRIRVGFSAVDMARLPPEVQNRWPRCDERGLVFVVGKLLADWLGSARDPKAAAIVARCVERRPTRRYHTLDDLQTALVTAGGHRTRITTETGWAPTEAELGLNLLEHTRVAAALAEAQRCGNTGLGLALERELEQRREAELRRLAGPEPPPAPREPEPTTEATIRMHLGRKAYVAALAVADELVAQDPASGQAHYLRGRCLFLLRRLEDARAAFARARTLAPTSIEAMLLAREVERSLANVREVVGSQPPLAMALPPHLAPLAPSIAAGDVDALAALVAQPPYADDAAAWLVVGGCLVFADRGQAALDAYARAERLLADPRAARIGEGFALLQLGRVAEALDVFAQYPDDLDALEGRARGLELQGETGEAERAWHQLVARRGGRAALRVRLHG